MPTFDDLVIDLFEHDERFDSVVDDTYA